MLQMMNETMESLKSTTEDWSVEALDFIDAISWASPYELADVSGYAPFLILANGLSARICQLLKRSFGFDGSLHLNSPPTCSSRPGETQEIAGQCMNGLSDRSPRSGTTGHSGSLDVSTHGRDEVVEREGRKRRL